MLLPEMMDFSSICEHTTCPVDPVERGGSRPRKLYSLASSNSESSSPRLEIRKHQRPPVRKQRIMPGNASNTTDIY